MKRDTGWVRLAGLAAALALLLIIASAPAARADGTYSYNDGLATWTYTVTGSSAAITGVALHSGSIGTLVIPEYVLSGSTYVPVTIVGGMSGIDTASVDKVVIPQYVTAIADNAFYSCTNIKSFDFRCSGLTAIGSSAFHSNLKLVSIDLPDSVTSIGSHAFDYCNRLVSITIPDGVKMLGDYCFSGCYQLTSVHLPDGLTGIGKHCFDACNHLPSINFPSGLQTIGDYAFQDCEALKSIDLPDTVTDIGAYAFYYCAEMTDAAIRSGQVGDHAFLNNPNLQKVTLGDGVTSIGSQVFDSCPALNTLSLLGHVTPMVSQVLTLCPGIGTLTAEPGNPYYCAVDSILYSKDMTQLVWCPSFVSGALTVPDTVTEIFPSACQNCVNMTSVILPQGLTAVGDTAFNGCSALTSLVFKGACPAFGSDCFTFCPGSLVVRYPVRYPASWASYSLTIKQPYAFVTWELQDGSTPTTTIENVNSGLIAAPADPARDGYAFAGWFAGLEDGATQWDFAAGIVADDLMLYAHWSTLSAITFDVSGGSAIGPISAAEGTVLTAPDDPIREGYTFTGWIPAFPATMPLGGAALTAQWTVNSYAVTFDSDGGSAVDPITADYGSALTAPSDPIREGCTFAGWSPVFPATMPLGGAALTAQWTVNSYTITFYSDGGSAAGPITADYGSALTAPSDPIREGCTFAGWSPAFPATMPLGGAALTAQWTINSYTVTFDVSGGSPVAAITAGYETTLTAPTAPVREGYTFAGWSPVFPATMPLGGAALTAQWTANSYTVTFDVSGGSPVAAITAGYETPLTPPAGPAREGYTFAGWSPAFPATMPLNGAALTAQWTANSYTVTFDVSSGSPVAVITAGYGTTLTAPAAPVREGYTFAGWVPAFPATMPAGGAALTAQWTVNRYTITFDSAGGSSVTAITADYGSILTKPADPIREDYTFAGWNPAFPATMPAGGAALTARWTVNRYTITFDSAGGSAVAAITADYGSPLTAPAAPTRKGYAFAGWNPAFPATMPAGGATLTAQWTVNRYTITFDSAGGSAVAAITADYGSPLTAPAAPTRNGYTFAGWNPAFPAMMPAGGATLTAQWTVNRYTITFDSAGGSAVAAITANYGSPLTAPAAPIRKGYAFAGWNPAFPATMPAGGATLTAQWNASRYTITFDSAGGSAVAAITADYGSPLTAPSVPTRNGYTFAGWSPAFPATMPLNGAKLTAQWTANRYTITFDVSGGSRIAPITAGYGSKLTAPAAPTKKGYTFAGWSPAFPAKMPLGGAKLTAKWTVNRYTITFDVSGGSRIAPITAGYGSPLTAPASPTRKGYTFAGWSPAFPATMPLNGAKLTAQWTVNRYTITFDVNGGSRIAPITAGYGSKLTAPAAPTRKGYTFAGWSPAFPAKMPLGGAKLTAQWTVNRYTITFDVNGGSRIAPITAGYGSKLTAPAAPTRKGYTFAGWSPAFPAKMPLGGAALTAKWTINRYTITFDISGGSRIAPITAGYGSKLTAPAAPTRKGYTFAGWNPAFPATMPLNGAKLTAQWAVNRYTITFDVSGGSRIAPITAGYGSKLTAPAAPTRKGYTFAGWNPAFPAKMPLGGAALTAKWTAK